MSRPGWYPTRAHLLVCTGPNCGPRGAQTLFPWAWEALEREGLAYYRKGGSLRLTACGCLGGCSYGPIVACYRRDGDRLQEAWYAGVTPESFLALARALHRGEPLPDRGRYDPGASGEGAD